MACTPGWLHQEEETSKPGSCLLACPVCVWQAPNPLPLYVRELRSAPLPLASGTCWVSSPVRLLLGLALPGKRQW